jgi:hypothetical protein
VADYDAKTTDPTLFIHRTTAEADIYFVSNQSEKKITLSPEFRINGKQPELWNPVTGTMRMLPEFTQKNGVTSVPLTLNGLESVFIVFRKNVVANAVAGINFPAPKISATISSPWTVQFDTKMRGTVQPVVFNELTDWAKSVDDNIKYYSGTAVYTNTFTTPLPAKGERIYLHLGDVKVMAKVKVNGIDVGGVWTAPWQLDITNAVKTGNNTLEISVVNTWVNRLIGDSKLPVAERKTWTSTVLYKPESPLQPSGLRGPVTVQYVGF